MKLPVLDAVSRRTGALRAPLAQRDKRLCWQCASVLLTYPDEQMADRLPLVRTALDDLPRSLAAPMRPLVEDLSSAVAGEHAAVAAQARYVDTFDHRRRRTLFLTYWTAGDTRNRGQAILRFVEAYRAAGAEPPRGELADCLPVVLEFAARVDPHAGRQLLARHATPLTLLHEELERRDSPYAGVVQAVLATLPAPGPGDFREARRLAMAGPPAEAVGLDLPGCPARSAVFPVRRSTNSVTDGAPR